jgi:dipeptidyl aminopeptidase/acylaminoacyl peptidase
VKGDRRGRGRGLVLVVAVLGACTSNTHRASVRPPDTGPNPGSATPDVLARYAPPPLPADIRSRVQSMLDVRAPGPGAVTLDGSRMFFTWSVTGTSQVWRLDGPQRFPVQLTGGEDPTTLADVMPDGRHIVVSRDRGGEENPGLYLQSADGGPLDVIFQKDKVQAFLAFVPEDGGSIYYRANDRKPDAYAIYRYDVTSRQSELVFDRDGLWDVADHRPDGRILLVKETGSSSREFYQFDLHTKALTPLLGQNEREDYEAALAREDDELIVLTPKPGNFRRLYRYRQGQLLPISPELNHDVSDFSIDEGRQRILYTVNENGYIRLRAMDAATFGDLALPALPAADRVRFGSTTSNGRFTTITVDTGRAPPASSVLDWVSGRLTQWHVPSAPEIDTSRFAGATLESYPARDGTPVPMFVRRPASCPAKPCPVIVNFHGGPESQSLAGFDPAAQLFVDAGFVFVEPNVRGSEGYGKAWLHADDGPQRRTVITDIEDCATFIRTHWGDGGRPPRIGVYGGSYGGYSALIGMTMFAGAYDAGASVVGMSNLVTFLEKTAPYRRALRVTEYGDPDKDRDALLQLSPITYVDRVKGPLLIIQGANDPRVPVGEAIQIQDALAAKKLDSRLIILPDEGHGPQKRDNRVLEQGHILQFFQTKLAVEPVKTG